jgi:asparagine synthase (glutamine-hydrolysing)
MCGIAGLFELDARADEGLVDAMRDRLSHRGPDDAGTWCEGNVGLGHRRLSIIDLSSEGHQPMASACGRYVIVYNGEIYNFDALRARLPGIAWRGHSDTEVLLAAIAAWGVETTLRRTVGMFAFALYDRARGALVLARDQLGIKPLYYGWCGSRFVFASELSAFDALPLAERRVDRNSLASMLRFSHVPAPHTIYEGMRKLLPGTWLELDTRTRERGALPEPVSFWSARTAATGPRASLDAAAAAEEALGLLRRAVGAQMVADVPLGAFLSGGVDSSLVVALMQEQSSRPVKTFTIGFEQAAFDESAAARRVARHLGTDHTELVMDERELLATVAEIPALCDEPFADSSILPTYLVSRLARRDVTVCLSGDGGDELFWGYTRYPVCERAWARIARLPRGLRTSGASVLGARPVRAAARWLPSFGLPGRPGRLSDKLGRIADVLRYEDQAEVYLDLVSHVKRPDEVVIGAREWTSTYGDDAHWSTELPMWRRMAVQDLLAYLPNDILTKVDRASMRVGLESRVPLLDHRFVDFCLALPDAVLRGGESKQLLRSLLARYVPRELTDRPKQGFGVPMAAWLRGPLRAWACDLLAAERLDADGFLDPVPVRRMLDEHLADVADWSASLWDVLMFQSWFDTRRRAAGAIGARTGTPS